MTENSKGQGLCLTCIHASVCMYLEKKKKPVVQCQEFCSPDGKGVEPLLNKTTVISSQTAAATEKNHSRSHKYAGLCMDCQHRETCMLSISPSGVWHCEEYE